MGKKIGKSISTKKSNFNNNSNKNQIDQEQIMKKRAEFIKEKRAEREKQRREREKSWYRTAYNFYVNL